MIQSLDSSKSLLYLLLVQFTFGTIFVIWELLFRFKTSIPVELFGWLIKGRLASTTIAVGMDSLNQHSMSIVDISKFIYLIQFT